MPSLDNFLHKVFLYSFLQRFNITETVQWWVELPWRAIICFPVLTAAVTRSRKKSYRMNVYWRGADTTLDRVLSDHLLTLSVETVATTFLLYRAIHYLKRLATSRLLTFACGFRIAWFPISLLKRVMMFVFLCFF